MVHHTIGLPLTRLTVSTNNEQLPQSLVSISPNPFDEFITVESTLPNADLIFLYLFDVAGQQVGTIPIQENFQQISTALFEKGLYFYKAVTEEGRMIGNGKIVKQ